LAILSAFARENLSIGLVAVAIVILLTGTVFRVLKVRARNRRRAAWRAQRIEEDRIWNEQTGKN
jgi:hypothetical protein